MPFQIGEVPRDGTQASQGTGAGGSPFMAILETLLGATDGQTVQAQTAGGQAADPEIIVHGDIMTPELVPARHEFCRRKGPLPDIAISFRGIGGVRPRSREAHRVGIGLA